MASYGRQKKNYRCVPLLQQFYTGGPFRLASDGSFLACACNDEVKVVDVAHGSIKATLPGDSEPIVGLAISPDDKFLFAASRSLQIKLWDLSTGASVRSWKGHSAPVLDMTCDASGGLLATGGADRNIFVWDVDGAYCTHSFRGHQAVVTTVVFHPDPHRLLLFSGSDDGTIRIWDLVSKKCIHVLEKHLSTVTSLAFSENGWVLLSAGRDKVVNIWDLRHYNFRATIPTFESLESLCTIPISSKLLSIGKKKYDYRDKKKKSGAAPVHFLTVGEKGIVRVWYSEGGVCLHEWKLSDGVVNSDKYELKGGFVSAILLPSDQGVLCVTADQRFIFCDVVESKDAEWDFRITKRLIGYNEEIVDLKFLGEEEESLAVATNIEEVRIYDLKTTTCTNEMAGHTDIILCLDTVTVDGHALLASGSKDHTVRVWDTKSMSCICIAAGHMGAVGAVAFSKKTKNFFASGSSDRTIKVWSLVDVLDLEDFNKPIELSSQAAVAAHDKDINTLAIAPNDSLLCSGSQDRTACIWRLPDLVPVRVLKGHKRGIWCVEFSPVDQCVMTASGDKTIKIWAISDGSCLKTFEGHTAAVLRASFVSRGTQFVSSGADGLLKLWTIKDNECIATFDQHEDKVWALDVGKKTEMLATGSGDSTVNLWHDCTLDDAEEEFMKQEEVALKDQELSNALADVDYVKAIQLAFELRRPYKLFNIFAELNSKENAVHEMQTVFGKLGNEELRLLLEYAREWNTKPKYCHVAQFLLFQLFNILPPAEILKIRGISELLEGLIPYSQRHYSRVDRLLRSTFLLDYTLSAMSVLSPQETEMDKNVTSKDHVDFPNRNLVSKHSVQYFGSADQVNATLMPAEKEEACDLPEMLASGENNTILNDENTYDQLLSNGSSKRKSKEGQGSENLKRKKSKKNKKNGLTGKLSSDNARVALKA